MVKVVTCVAPVNIAVIKYWGKKDEELIIPLNDSLSSTLGVDQLCAKTTVTASPNFTSNRFWLNGKEETFDSPRLINCLKELKKKTQQSSSELLNWNIHVCSENNFPTAAGLASSAAGYACLVFALATLYNVEGDISAIARRGSGSACRSVYGGWVQWHAGTSKDGLDSIATQIVPASHWPQMRILILVVNDARKKVGSTAGMQLSVETSPFLQYRADHIVEPRIKEIVKAIRNRDFETFGKITMQDSNQFHSVTWDTFPPCPYLNDVSQAIIRMVHGYNDHNGSTKLAYTFDAGPNACLYMLEDDVAEVAALVKNVFPPSPECREYVKGIPIPDHKLSKDLLDFNSHKAGTLKYLIHTHVGDGPRILTDPSQHLLTSEGLPKTLVS